MAAIAKMVRMTSFLDWHYHSVGHAILGASHRDLLSAGLRREPFWNSFSAP